MHVVAVWVALATLGAGPTSYKFDDPNHRDTVTFELDAPFETINGITNTVVGEVTISGGKASGEFHVPVDTLKTGNDARDGHLKSETWLDAAKNPNIILKFKDIPVPELADSKPVKIHGTGLFTIHGVEKPQNLDLEVTYFKESETTHAKFEHGDALRVKGTVDVPLADYKIERTQHVLLKVGDTAHVKVDLIGNQQK
jgi:polyisoprenoid-binding protein YceI